MCVCRGGGGGGGGGVCGVQVWCGGLRGGLVSGCGCVCVCVCVCVGVGVCMLEHIYEVKQN